MMQNAKDTFYEMLRGRLAAVNPERAIVVRGVSRPGVLVEENELVTAVHLPDCFRLSWNEVTTDSKGALPLVTLQCSIGYETGGSANSGGMDRGRLLAAMDGELQAALCSSPMSAVKNNYSSLANGGAVVAMGTSLWWSPPTFGKTEVNGDRVARTASVAVMSYIETGEL